MSISCLRSVSSGLHGDAAEEVESARDGSQGGVVRAFEVEEAEHGRLERNKEAEETQEGWVTCVNG